MDDEDDDDSDDLNPSKLSEYDDDKCDKESVLSGMTMSSSSARGNDSVASSMENVRKSAYRKKVEKPKGVSHSGSSFINQVI